MRRNSFLITCALGLASFTALAQLRGMFTVPATTAKTWMYHFSHLSQPVRDPKRGVSHASELAYVFGTIPPASDKTSHELSDAMVRYWAQFAKTGDPNQGNKLLD